MKICVIGSGGREHALCSTFFRQGHQVFSYPGNPGMDAVATPLSKSPGLLDDYDRLAKLIAENQIDITVVGSETHLVNGIQDFFSARGLFLFGPSKLAARIESSKAWAKDFMVKYGIPTAAFTVCTTPQAAREAAKALFQQGKGVVVKASGLAAGKGVVCCSTYEEAEEAIFQIAEMKIYGSAGEQVVIEELISGPELSLQAITDGKTILPLIAAQDHKRVYDNDCGPNTGGMGAYAPLPYPEEIERTIIQPTLRGLQEEGIPYCGILYFGLMLTQDGPKVLEYNCRFGDPETQAILPLLESDLAQLMLGNLTEVRWKPQACCCVVLAAKGYPGTYSTGHPICELQDKEDLFFFQAGTSIDAQDRLVTAGGRVLGVTALGGDLEEAIARAYKAIDAQDFLWAHYRRDIGRAAITAPI